MKPLRSGHVRGQSDEENPYWISFSDIMSGLLVLFMLVSLALILELISKRQELNRQLEIMERIDHVRARVLTEIKEDLESKNILVEVSDNDSVIRVPDKLLTFASGSSDIPDDDESRRIVREIGETVRGVIVKDDRYRIFDTIFVEGHTDNQPFHSPMVMGNWGLSTNRAIKVWNYWDGHIVDAPKLSSLLNHADTPLFSVSGYGETRPIQTPQNTDEQRQRNRRIDIRFTVRRPTQEDYRSASDILEDS